MALTAALSVAVQRMLCVVLRPQVSPPLGARSVTWGGSLSTIEKSAPVESLAMFPAASRTSTRTRAVVLGALGTFHE